MAVLAIVHSAGCSTRPEFDPSDVIPVVGTLTYQGRPVAGAQIALHRDDMPEPAFAFTNARGKFTCMTNDTNGVYPGEYRVTVLRRRGGIPERYADAKTSPLTITVEKPSHELAIVLDD